jgi:endonuclease/exonuclease/phosphatase (EEP) superfamily protein YafD
MPILTVLLGAFTLVSLFRRAHWPFELLTHFRPHMIAAGAAVALACLLLGERWEWAAIAAGIALVNYAALPAPRWTKPEERLASMPGVTIVWANVWHKQAPLDRTLAWAKAQGADVILIGEYASSDAAEALHGDYPHRLHPAPPPEGVKYARRVVAFSRLPIENGQIRQGPGPSLRPFVSFSVRVGDQSLDIIGTHPTPPTWPKLLQERDRHIGTLAALTSGVFVLVGDFNATPWAPVFKSIPGRRVGGYLLAPTWFSNLPLIGLPIDHIMASPAIKVSAYRVARFTGSDHRAILARVHP